MATRSGRRPDLPRLTTMRGIGAVVIVIGHFALTKSLPTDAMNNFLIDLLQVVAVAGVSCFFALSGFVLTWASPPGMSAKAFWRGRFARLFPVHAVTWTFGIVTMLACGVAFEFWKMLPSLALINIWIPDLDVFWGANTPSWTLAAEAFFYACFPVLLVAAWRLPERWLFPALGIVALLITLWAAAVGLFVPGTHDITDGTPLSRAQYFAIVAFAPARLLDFILGILLARIVIAGRVPGGLRPWLYLSLIGGYVAARWVIPQPLGFVCAMVPAVVIGLLYSASADLAGSPSRWSTKRMQWLGEISYPLYLVHWPVLFGAHRALGDPQWSVPVAVLFCAAALAVSIGLAHLLHTKVELPMYQRWARKRTARTPAKASSARPRPIYTAGGTRTPTVSPPADFESAASTIPPPPLGGRPMVRGRAAERLQANSRAMGRLARLSPWCARRAPSTSPGG
jgi:peptidoglycan/LPS O-acetylase OafA/YrhL